MRAARATQAAFGMFGLVQTLSCAYTRLMEAYVTAGHDSDEEGHARGRQSLPCGSEARWRQHGGRWCRRRVCAAAGGTARSGIRGLRLGHQAGCAHAEADFDVLAFDARVMTAALDLRAPAAWDSLSVSCLPLDKILAS